MYKEIIGKVCEMKIIKNMVDFIRSAIVALISCLLTLFSPIQDILVGMVVLLTLNGVCGLFADIINGNGWEMNKATKFLVQCFVYFVLVMALFVVGHFIHKHDEAITCVKIIMIITTWVFSINILRNCRNCCPQESSMYKLLDILYYIVSVQIVEKIPFVASYIARKGEEK